MAPAAGKSLRPGPFGRPHPDGLWRRGSAPGPAGLSPLAGDAVVRLGATRSGPAPAAHGPPRRDRRSTTAWSLGTPRPSLGRSGSDARDAQVWTAATPGPPP